MKLSDRLARGEVSDSETTIYSPWEHDWKWPMLPILPFACHGRVSMPLTPVSQLLRSLAQERSTDGGFAECEASIAG